MGTSQTLQPSGLFHACPTLHPEGYPTLPLPNAGLPEGSAFWLWFAGSLLLALDLPQAELIGGSFPNNSPRPKRPRLYFMCLPGLGKAVMEAGPLMRGLDWSRSAASSPWVSPPDPHHHPPGSLPLPPRFHLTVPSEGSRFALAFLGASTLGQAPGRADGIQVSSTLETVHGDSGWRTCRQQVQCRTVTERDRDGPWAPALSWLSSPEGMLAPGPGVSQPHPPPPSPLHCRFSPALQKAACHLLRSRNLRLSPPHHLPRAQIFLPHPSVYTVSRLLSTSGEQPELRAQETIAYPFPSSRPLLPSPSSTCVAPGMPLLFHASETLHVLIPLLGIHSPPLSYLYVIHSPQYLPLPQWGRGTPSMCHSITVQ